MRLQSGQEGTRQHDVVVGIVAPECMPVAAAVNLLGGTPVPLTIATEQSGSRHRLKWVATSGRVTAFGINGTGSSRSGLISSYPSCNATALGWLRWAAVPAGGTAW